MKELILELTPQLVAVLEHTRSNMLDACRYGSFLAKKNTNELMVEKWNEEADMIRSL